MLDRKKIKPYFPPPEIVEVSDPKFEQWLGNKAYVERLVSRLMARMPVPTEPVGDEPETRRQQMFERYMQQVGYQKCIEQILAIVTPKKPHKPIKPTWGVKNEQVVS
jgi:hypothetical protein